MKKVHIQSFGCQMNDYDVERIVEVMRGRGWEPTEDERAADLIVLNTCAIREKAEHKMASALGRLRPLKQARPDLLLAVGGCVPTLEGEPLLAQLPFVDFTFGPDAIPRLPALVDEATGGRRRFAAVAFTEVEAYDFLDAAPLPGDVRTTALVTIQKGCDNDCAYCVVPTTRGPEVSRPAGEVVAEVERFVAAGAREVTLIGQNVNSYRGLRGGFPELLARVDAVPGLLRVRFTTSHPKDFDERVADCFRDLPRLCEWLHLPVQSGSTRVLASMTRTYSREEYLRKIDYVRTVCPDIAITTDVIVGYPGESDDEFGETLSLLERVQYDGIYSFKYSVRPRTPALSLGDTVPEPRKAERLAALQELQAAIGARRLARFVGRTEEVLVEGESRHGGQACGRTRTNYKVNFALPDGAVLGEWVGRLARLDIVTARAHSLEGRLPAPEAKRRVSLPVQTARGGTPC
ncbi:MAG: tRNA (N6-isopentenyl adenosine(37)-C2)-methylthiotransferase MiaB [Myxococcota bacterium]